MPPVPVHPQKATALWLKAADRPSYELNRTPRIALQASRQLRLFVCNQSAQTFSVLIQDLP